ARLPLARIAETHELVEKDAQSATWCWRWTRTPAHRRRRYFAGPSTRRQRSFGKSAPFTAAKIALVTAPESAAWPIDGSPSRRRTPTTSPRSAAPAIAGTQALLTADV